METKLAWYLDEDVLLEGFVKDSVFYPKSPYICGFSSQEIDANLIDRELFFDLNKAFSVCGDVPVVKAERFNEIYDHQIVAINRSKMENQQDSIIYRDTDGGLHQICLDICAKNYRKKNHLSSGNCAGVRDVLNGYYAFYTSGITTRIVFAKKYVTRTASKDFRDYILLTGFRKERFEKFRNYLSETKYITYDLT